ncbi:hypothetical protein SAMD00019534_088850, partial [Acytostelium subglobosum LB1]|uniref:hypothetical protein n=1 Tax=Acytostelium subglobosum LB1 TaxID=1410327 RepID=UPI000644AB1C
MARVTTRGRLQMMSSHVGLHQLFMLLCLCMAATLPPTTTALSPPSTTTTTQLSVNCHDLGFTESLLCSSCQAFEEFMGNSDAVDECKKCCSVEALHQKKTYTKAEVVICR